MSKKLHKSNANITDLVLHNYIGSELTAQIETLYNKVTKGDEFEFIFFSKKGKYLPQEKYIYLLKYFNKRSEDNTSILHGPEDSIDIIFPIDDVTVIRCSIIGSANFNAHMKKLSSYKNHVIFSNLARMWIKGDKTLNFMKKVKDQGNTIDVDDLDMRVRLSKESDLSKDDIEKIKNLDEKSMNKITYRYKQRTSLFIKGNEDSDENVRVDLTFTRTTDSFKKLNRSVPNYELEVEYGTKTNPKQETLSVMMKETELLLKLIQQSNYVVTNSLSQNVLTVYRNIFSVTEEKLTALDARQSITLELQHVTELLPNKYAVTDKADGDRYFMIIHESHCYLISTNLNVRDTGIQLDKKLEKYNGSVLDGEYIFLEKHNRHVFLVFDCMFVGSTDIRTNPKLMERLAQADEIINACFILANQKGYNISKNVVLKTKSNKFDVNEYTNSYYEDITAYMKALNEDIGQSKQFPLVRRKYFVGCMGAKNWEIFAYATLLWNTYTSDSNVNCPYLLDGLVFQPLEQGYITSVKESQKPDFKWKPQEKNSIDFYIEFEKDRDTGKILTVYDNSNNEYVRNKPYKICNLYVGQRLKSAEHPVLFKSDQELYLAYLFLDNGEVRDAEGNILTDRTVVEFYYNDNPDVPEKFKWVPLRTRYDKTESVLRFGKKYGNYLTIAEKVWRSIINPVLMTDFDDLAKGNNTDTGNFYYDKKMEILRKKIGHELIISATKENIYYQQRSRLATPMRQFHNWIKSNIIYTYCHPMYQSNKQLSILDLACGRGGDIMKFYYSMAAFYVGVDIDKEGLVSAVDGAVSRYNQLRRKPNFPKMYFIQGDVGALLNSDDQTRALKGMSIENKQLMDKFFSKDEKRRTMFDRINCQFAVHYLLRDEITWANFKQNINMHLRNGGYFLATAFDSQKIVDLLADKDRHVSEYTDETGKKKVLFEIVKKYTGTKNDIMGTGNAIDVYMAWISQEGRYLTEFLVDRRYFEKELLEGCGLELVDTDNFGNQFTVHKDFFDNYAKFEEIEETRQFLKNVSDFYKSGEINEGCHIYNSLMRYYIFRKKDGVSKQSRSLERQKKDKKSKSKQSGGASPSSDDSENIEDLEYDFSDNSQFSIGNMEEYDNEYSCLNSIHQLLRSHKIIPKNVRPEEIYQDFGIDLVPDIDIDVRNLSQIGKKLIIEHDVKADKQVVINGINIFVVERNCNDEFDIDLYSKSKIVSPNQQAIILMKEGDLFLPLYQIDAENRRRGIFTMKDKLIKWMVDSQ